MSWSIKSIGLRDAVKRVVNSNPSISSSLKSAIVEIIDEDGNGNSSVIPARPHDSVRVEGYGHSGGGYGSIGKLEVELFTAATL